MQLINDQLTHMKNICAFLLAATLFTACKPETIGDVPHQETAVVNSLAGTWTLSKVTVTDKGSEIKNSPYLVKDVTSIFPFKDFKLTLNANGGTPSTFTTTKGNAPAVIALPSGNWKVDNAEAPKAIQFINGTDTLKSTIGSYPTNFRNTFSLRVEKREQGKEQVEVIYDYIFTKQ